jgi:hypothetical protein
MPHCSIIGSVSRQHHAIGLSFNHLQLSRSIIPYISIHRIYKLREADTVNMDVEELTSHREALRLIKKDLNFATQNTAEV